MNFESELSAKQPSDHLNNVSNNNSDTAHNACASDKPCHITKKCGRKVCLNRVELQQNTYNCSSKIMFKTASGYRNKASNFCLYHFCSEECLEHFKKYSCCHKCNEDCTRAGKGTFVDKFGYTLCNGRGDMEPPCISIIASHELEKRFAQEYVRYGYYRVDSQVIDKMIGGYDGLKQIIAANEYMISYNMLKDMHEFSATFEIPERENEDLVDEETFYEYYNKIKDELL